MQRIKLSPNVLESENEIPWGSMFSLWHEKIVKSHLPNINHYTPFILCTWRLCYLYYGKHSLRSIIIPIDTVKYIFSYRLPLLWLFSDLMDFLLFARSKEVKKWSILCQVLDPIMYEIEYLHPRVSQHQNEDPLRTYLGYGCDTLPRNVLLSIAEI